jgi:hypothetical protein
MQKSYQSSKRFSQGAKQATKSSKAMGDSISRAANSVAVIDGPLGGVAGRLSSVAAGFNSVGVAATLAGTAIAATTYAVIQSASAYADLERRQAKTNALLKATGFSAGFTGRELDSMARQVALGTLASTQDVREAIDVLLTFKSVRGKEFQETIKLSQDLAVVIGGSTKTAALQLGKALEDPILGMTALRRSGVSFTQAEKEMVEQMVEANNVLEAQQLILSKVAAQVGGAGSAEAQGLSGAVDTLSQRWGEMLEAMGKTLATSSTVGAALRGITRGIEDITLAIDPTAAGDWEYYSRLTEELAGLQDRARRRQEGEISKRGASADNSRINELKAAIKAVEDRMDAEKKAKKAAQDAAKEAEKIEKAERAAAKAAEERAKALEKAQKIMEKQGSLWQKIFGGGSQRKTTGPVIDNSHFNFAALKAKGSIETGNASSAKQFIEQMEQVLRFANRDTKRNFDVKGMQEVIDAMNALAGSKFGDITKAISDQKLEARYDYTVGGKRYVGKGDPITGKTGASKDAAESVLQVHSEQVNLSLTADSAKAMTEQVSKAIESVTQQSKMPNLGTLKLELKNGDSQDVLEVLTTAEGVRIIERIAEQSTQNSARAVAR